MIDPQNPWLKYSPAEAEAALGEILARSKAMEGLKFSGQVDVIEVTRTQGIREDLQRRRLLRELFECFPQDIQRLLWLLLLTQETQKYHQARIEVLEEEAKTLDDISLCAARLLYLVRAHGLKNFLRVPIGDGETREVFEVEVRRKPLSKEETDAWFGSAQRMEDMQP